jgi:hypothetical protein
MAQPIFEHQEERVGEELGEEMVTVWQATV